MKIAVIGATGTIGREITRLCKENGDNVIAVSRNSNPAINIDNPVSVEHFFENISELDAIICAAGNASFGDLTTLTDDQFQVGITSKLMGQVNLVRKGLKSLNSEGVIILTGGILAYSPMPQTSNIAMVNSGLEGFVKAASLELTEGKRVVIVHPPFVKETASALGMDSDPWPSAAKAAETYIEVLTSQKNGVPVFVKGYIPEK